MKILKIATLAVLVLGQAAYGDIRTYSGALLGGSEDPANASTGTGEATVIINTVLQTMEVHVTFSGLVGITTASLIHCCTASPDTGNAGVATEIPAFPGFPLGGTSGSYDMTLDLTSSSFYNPSFVTAEGSVATAEAALVAGIAAGDAYLNIHTTVYPGGEIRGFLEPASVPEPATLLLTGAWLAGIAILRRRRAA
jgi:hypothetical protein